MKITEEQKYRTIEILEDFIEQIYDKSDLGPTRLQQAQIDEINGIIFSLIEEWDL